MESAQAGEQGSSGLHWGGGQPSSPIAHGLSSLRVCQLGRVGGASGAPTGSSTWTVQSPEQRLPERIRKQRRRPQAHPAGGSGVRTPASPSSAQPPRGSAGPWGGGRAAPYQADVERVVVILRHGHVHGQGHAVGKDGEQDDGLEGSAASVKE